MMMRSWPRAVAQGSERAREAVGAPRVRCTSGTRTAPAHSSHSLAETVDKGETVRPVDTAGREETAETAETVEMAGRLKRPRRIDWASPS